MATQRWRKCPTCNRYTLDVDGKCGGIPKGRRFESEAVEGCGNPFPTQSETNSKLQVRGGPTPKFHSHG